MTLAFSLVVAALFGCGAYLLLKPDLVRVIAGITLVSQSAILTLLASSLTIGRAPIHPIDDVDAVSDPLPQAMALTALVIGLASIALLLALAERVLIARDSGDPAAESDPESDAEPDTEPDTDTASSADGRSTP